MRISLLDVTIRDGGYVNGHSWTTEEAAGIVRAVGEAGVQFTEVGYLRGGEADPLRPSAFCRPDYLRVLAAEAGRTGLAVMVRPGEVAPERLKDLREYGVGMVRVLVSRLDVVKATPYLDAALASGLALAVNLTHASRATSAELAAAARRSAEAGAEYVYLADSNGSLYPDGVADRVGAVADAVAGSGATVGFHPHDNLGLAFAGTSAALAAGARAVDASIGGIGKGGGNLRLELIAAHLTVHRGADYRLEPLLRDRSTHAARLRMLADGTAGTLVSGLLDVSLDQARQFQEQAVRHGYDALLRNGLRIAS